MDHEHGERLEFGAEKPGGAQRLAAVGHQGRRPLARARDHLALIAADGRGYMTAAAVNLVMSAHEDAAAHAAVLGATLAVPDGQPLVWALRALGHTGATRVYGPDLMALYCARAAAAGTDETAAARAQ